MRAGCIARRGEGPNRTQSRKALETRFDVLLFWCVCRSQQDSKPKGTGDAPLRHWRERVFERASQQDSKPKGTGDLAQ